MKDLTFESIKVGGRYKIKPGREHKCTNCSDLVKAGSYLIITQKNNYTLYYNLMDEERAVKYCFNCYKPEDLLPFGTGGFSELNVGDTFGLNGSDDVMTVLYSNGNVIIAEDSLGRTQTISGREFNDRFHLITEPTELSMNEIAEKFGVPVEQLKIKKD